MNIKKILVGAAASAVMLGAMAIPAFADSTSVNFEPATYVVGNINGQDGWTKTGSFDSVVAPNTYGFVTFGTQSLRISDEVTSGSFGDQTFAKPLSNAVGEADSTDGTFSRGTLQNHFETQFDIASTKPTEQAGMHTSVSPDRGDGSRMSYLRFEDQSDGIHVFFDDVTSTGTPGSDTFNETDIATVSRTPHTIKLTMDMVDGPSNDVVKVYVDGVLKITGTSWEDYYRFDPEASAEQSPRIVKTVLFRESGDANVADSGFGFLFDNMTTNSSTVSSPVGLGSFRDVRRASDINVGPDLGGTGHQALNFTGSTGSAGDSWVTVYDTTPGDSSSATMNIYGSVNLTGDVLIHPFNNRKGAGLLALYNEGVGKKGLGLIVYDNGNTDALVLATIDHVTGKVTNLQSVALGSGIAENAWYNVQMNVNATTGAVTGKVFKHSSATDPNSSALVQVGTTLTSTGPRPTGVDVTGEVGFVGSAISAVIDTSVTNFTVNGTPINQ